jgi:outer membrane receptor for ferrienterochelin and colicin
MTLTFLRKNQLLLLLCLGIHLTSLNAQNKYTLSGTITDRNSGEALIGATIRELRSGKGAVTNTFGFYSLTLPATDTILISVSYVGYKPLLQAFSLKSNLEASISLEETSVLQEVEIVAERYEQIEERAQMSRIDIPIEQIKNIPALLGEKDILRALQLLPGVSGGGEGQSGIYVRGGGPDQNLILLDGVPVYNASHLFGFFSVFNTDAIKDVSLIKGGFPARYGGRLSSVIDITMKEGNDQAIHGEGSIGLVASKLTLEGPLKKGKSSFIVSGRRTYIDLLARPLIQAGFRSDGSEGVTGYYFDDINAKVNYRFSNKDRLYLSYYSGSDAFYLRFSEKNEDQQNRTRYESKFANGLGWGNRTAALRWNHTFNPKLFANTTLTYSRYQFNTNFANEDKTLDQQGKITQESAFELNYNSGINDWAGKIDLDYVPNPDHYVRMGAGVILHNFQPGNFRSKIYSVDSNDTLNITNNQTEPDIQAAEFALYAEDDWKITDRLRINAGLHLSGFQVKGEFYSALQPRVNLRYRFERGWSLKAAYSTMQQYIHLLTNETIGLPTDLWLPTTSKVRPQQSWQTALGAAKTWKGYETSIEVFYKEMNNVIAFNEGASAFQFQGWEDRISQGKGTAYGAEFFVQKKAGKLTGWVGYTLSWAWRQFDQINNGEKYPYKFDRRHDFEITAAYKFNERISLASTWVFATGNAVTFGNARYQGPLPYSQSFNYFLYENEHTPNRNNFRMPNYHRLDVGMDFTKKKKRYTRTWSVGAYNGYNRANPFFLFRDNEPVLQPDGTFQDKEVLKKAALFPVIPYLSWGFKF